MIAPIRGLRLLRRFNETKGVDGDNHADMYVYECSCMHMPSFLPHSPSSGRFAISFLWSALAYILSYLPILLSSIEILSIAMESKYRMTTLVDISAPDYDLGLSSDDDAAALGKFIIACQSPSLTFNQSETWLQAGVASKLLQARNFCNRVQYYGAFAFHCLNSQLFHSCWASWYGLGLSRRV